VNLAPAPEHGSAKPPALRPNHGIQVEGVLAMLQVPGPGYARIHRAVHEEGDRRRVRFLRPLLRCVVLQHTVPSTR
jgi:hypothetical protein